MMGLSSFSSSAPNDGRVSWRDEFINCAKSVKDLQFILENIDETNQQKDEAYRKKIITKMQEIAITQEDKQIAFSFHTA